MSQPTPFSDLNTVLDHLVEGLLHILGDDLVAVCLQGSFAVGDFDTHSDVDFIVVTRTELSQPQVDALQALHPRIHDLDCPWAQHLEGSYFPASVLRSLDRRGEDLWYLDHGSRTLVRSDHCNTAVVRQTVRQHGIVLAGSLESLIDPVPLDVLRDEMRGTIVGWGRQILDRPEAYDNRFYQGFIALNYCRMWRDLTTGTVGSKRQGAEWASERLGEPFSSLLGRSWSTRIDPATTVRQPANPDDYALTLDLVRLVIEACQVP